MAEDAQALARRAEAIRDALALIWQKKVPPRALAGAQRLIERIRWRHDEEACAPRVGAVREKYAAARDATTNAIEAWSAVLDDEQPMRGKLKKGSRPMKNEDIAPLADWTWRNKRRQLRAFLTGAALEAHINLPPSDMPFLHALRTYAAAAAAVLDQLPGSDGSRGIGPGPARLRTAQDRMEGRRNRARLMCACGVVEMWKQARGYTPAAHEGQLLRVAACLWEAAGGKPIGKKTDQDDGWRHWLRRYCHPAKLTPQQEELRIEVEQLLTVDPVGGETDIDK